MRNLILFFTIFLTITASLCIGVPRYYKSAPAAPPLPVSVDNQHGNDKQQQGDDGTPSTPPASPALPLRDAAIPDIGSLQVLNGCGVKGVADSMANYLKAKNFDVKDIGNASSWNYPATMVISRNANMEIANAVEKVLKTGKVVLIRNKDEHLYDVTVVVGHDFEERIK